MADVRRMNLGQPNSAVRQNLIASLAIALSLPETMVALSIERMSEDGWRFIFDPDGNGEFREGEAG